MSLKAYNGMMTKNGYDFLQRNVIGYMPEFKAASQKALAKAYAKCIVDLADNCKKGLNPTLFLMQSKSSYEEELISKVDSNTTVLSYIFQCAKILSKSLFVNDFTVQLNLAIESTPSKILVMPNILVKKHKSILLQFLDDWYAQNQTDPDEDVPAPIWEERCNDWWNFGNKRHYQSRITLFDPTDHWNDLVDDFRGEELIESILAEIDDEKRKKSLYRDLHYAIYLKDKGIASKDAKMGDYFGFTNFLETEQAQQDLEKIKQTNPIELVKIDAAFLNSKYPSS